MPSYAKPSKKQPGAWAWTRGSQTYIRARPSVDTPPVAKVARHTKLFVWGKFDGWYRVETSDHKFGWIFNSYLNPSDKDKIAELSHRRARLASNRTKNQTMYGSTQMLRAHYARYGAKGALTGLQKKGVRVRLAKTPDGRTRLTTKRVVKSAPRLAQATRKLRVFRTIKTSVAAPRLTSTRAAISPPGSSFTAAARADENRLTRTPDGTINSNSRRTVETRTDTVETATITPRERVAETNRAEARRAAARRAAIRAEEARLAALRAESARLEKQRLEQQRLLQAERGAATRAANAQRLAERNAQAERDAQAQRLADSRRAAELQAQRLANAKREREERLAAAQKRQAARRAAAEKRRAARLAKVKARRERARLYAARKASEREALRRRMSMTPPSSQAEEMGLRPLSPEELLRARERFLSSRHKTRPVAPRKAAPNTRDNLFERSAPGSGFNSQSSSQEQSASSFQQMNYTSGSGNFGMKALHTGNTGGFMLVTQTLPVQKTIAPRPADARFSRGGSPRDYARNRSRDMGKGVALQALSYRGMPYIRGASSARRGFDCSGLIYFLMRQRGYNPPRTAAGLASFGKRVPRHDLQAGDIVLFSNTYKRGVSHVGVYIGNNNFVHAANRGSGVKTDSLTSGYYARKYHGARRAQ